MPVLAEKFREEMTSPADVISRALDEILSNKTPAKIKANFSLLVERTEEKAYSIYLAAEKKCWKKVIRDYAKRSLRSFREETVTGFLESQFGEFDKFFLSLAQSRKARAGKAFETIIRSMFKKLGYPFTEQAIINGKPDFLMPSREYYAKNAPECIIFTAKRTLRERWRQIVTEGTRGLGFFLATIDGNISSNQLDEMRNNRIWLVVPTSIKQANTTYSRAANVIDFETFFEDYLDPAMKRWKKSGAINA